MSEIRVNNLSNENQSGGPTISGITTFSSPYFFVPPSGNTANRPSGCPSGSLRFNTDNAHLEYYRGDGIGWSAIEASSEELSQGNGNASNTGLGHRGFALGGHEGPNGSDTYTAEIDFFTISTLGDATKFGDLNNARGNGIAGFASRTRGIGAGGYAPDQNIIEFITMSSTGDATDFGDLTSNREGPMGCSDSTRGIVAAGWARPNSADIKEIDYVTIADTGNSLDFGDLISPTNYGCGTASSTRGLLIGGYSSPSPQVYENRIEFITIASTGNGTDFGDVNATNTNLMSAASNATRGLIWGGGGDGSNLINNIEFVTIATTGNAIDCGDMLAATQGGGAMSSPTRCVYYSGNGGASNVIEFVEIASTGNAVDFGDAATGSHGKYTFANFSNGHGGL